MSVNTVEQIKQAIYNHLQMKTNGALLVTGDWGSGKTYFFKNYIFPEIEKEASYIPILISLYGETDKNNISQRILYSYFDKQGKKVKLSTGAIAKNLKTFSEAIPIIKKYVDVNKLVTGTGENLFRFLPYNELLLCFDDLERMSESIHINDFLGIVNELVENRGCKVILIANESKINKGILFKEKTIEKTVHFLPDINSVFESIINEYEKDTPFRLFLKENWDFFKSSFNYNSEKLNEGEQKELKSLLSNIRTLKFAIEHFKIPFEIVNKSLDINQDLVKIQLKNLWLFTLAISVEFKQPDNISFTSKKNLDEYKLNIPNLDNDSNLNFLENENEETENRDDEYDYVKRFTKLYYERLSEPYIFYPELYDLITAGQVIVEKKFLKRLEDEFNVEEGKVNPAHELLKQFLYNIWNFSNDEFSLKINQLLTFVEEGRFNDLISYINSAVYLLEFKKFLECEKDTIVTKTKVGINKAIRNIPLNSYAIAQLEIVQDQSYDSTVKSILDYINEEIKAKQIYEFKEEASRLENLMVKSPAEITKVLTSYNSTFRTPDAPLFNLFNLEKIISAIPSWEPNDIISLFNLLKYRYLDTSFNQQLTVELSFLEGIQDYLKSWDSKTLNLSYYLIRRNLKPRLAEVIDKLKCKGVTNEEQFNK